MVVSQLCYPTPPASSMPKGASQLIGGVVSPTRHHDARSKIPANTHRSVTNFSRTTQAWLRKGDPNLRLNRCFLGFASVGGVRGEIHAFVPQSSLPSHTAKFPLCNKQPRFQLCTHRVTVVLPIYHSTGGAPGLLEDASFPHAHPLTLS